MCESVAYTTDICIIIKLPGNSDYVESAYRKSNRRYIKDSLQELYPCQWHRSVRFEQDCETLILKYRFIAAGIVTVLLRYSCVLVMLLQSMLVQTCSSAAVVRCA